MRIFKYKHFSHWAKELRLDDTALLTATKELEKGLYDANLGGGIYKKRIAIGARGKRDGVRTIIAFKEGGYICFHIRLC
jgi:hypothetical protein